MGGGAEGNTATRIEASPSDRGGRAGHSSRCRDGSGDGRRARRDYAACIRTDGACHRHRARTRDGAIDAASSTANARAAAAKPPANLGAARGAASAARLSAAADDGRTSVRAALSSACGEGSTPAAIRGIGRAEPYHVVLVCVTIRNRDLCVDLRYLTDCGREKIVTKLFAGRIAPSSPT